MSTPKIEGEVKHEWKSPFRSFLGVVGEGRGAKDLKKIKWKINYNYTIFNPEKIKYLSLQKFFYDNYKNYSDSI